MSARSTIVGIVLAGGLSRRAGGRNKLLRTVAQQPVVRGPVAAMVEAGLHEILVVTGHQREDVEHALRDLAVRFVFAADYAQGMGRSLAAGVRAAPVDARAFVVCPGDLPLVSAALVRSVVDQFRAEGETRHIIPTFSGQRGHPVVLGAWLRSELENLEGDAGARWLLATPEERSRCVLFPSTDRAVIHDVDTPEMLAD